MRTWNGIRVGILGAIAAALLIAPGVAAAADYRVTTTADGDDKECADDCTLREAVVLASSADRVVVPSGNYVLTMGELFLVGDVIVGQGARTTFIDGGGQSRVIQAGDGTARISGVTIRNGSAGTSELGGGIYVSSGSLLLQTVAVSGNTAGYGGGIAAAGTLQILDSAITGNTASALRLSRGGGIYAGGTLAIGNTTVSGNTAAGGGSRGGGVDAVGSMLVIASTIAANNAADGGGGLHFEPAQGGTGQLTNSIVQNGTGGACAGDGIGGMTAVGNVASDATCQLKDPSNLNNTNPQLGALANNGGPTNTHALAAGSPAIGRATSCASNDQRGVARITPCDSGAYEFAGTLRVVTSVTNDNGGTLAPSSFSVHVRRAGAEVTGSPAPGSAAGTTYTLDAATYAVEADARAGYALSYSADCNAALAGGQTRTCTITANDIGPTLRVVTQVTNDNGGTLTPAAVNVHVRTGGTDVSGSPAPGLAAGRTYTLSAGPVYTASADAVTGYAISLSGTCSTALALAQGATCTITANDVAPTLRVITNMTNNEGGTLQPSGVTTRVRQGATDVTGSPAAGSTTGTQYTLSAGIAYTVGANAVTGYTLGVTGACAANGSITLTPGQNATCTITANDIPPTLRVITQVINDSGGTLAPGNFSARVRAGGTDVNGSPQPGTSTGTLYTLSAGVAYVASLAPVSGYAFSASAGCSITLALDQDATCTLTANDGAAQLDVVTQVVNDDGGTATPAAFGIAVRNGAVTVAGPVAGTPSGHPFALTPGSYTVATSGPAGYAVTTSGDCDGAGAFTIALGQQRECTVTANDVAPTLTVVTNVVNDHGGSAGPGSFTVHVRAGGADVAGSPQPGSAAGTTYTLDAGSYAVAADPLAGYASDGCSVTLSPGQNATCTVTANDDAPPQGTQDLPPPVVGKSVNALPASGKVQYKLPATSAYVQLAEGEQIPVGTIIDVLKGRVTLVASDGKGGTATADFYGGIFKLGQTKAGLTVLTLVEKLSCAKAKKAGTAAKKKTKRRLWGDGSGKFQTKGKHSAATVVGTKWLVADTCTTTLTRVDRGRVSVRDFIKKKTVLVKAGKKYVARAKQRR